MDVSNVSSSTSFSGAQGASLVEQSFKPNIGQLGGISVKPTSGPAESPVGTARLSSTPTNLQVQGDSTFRQLVAQDLTAFAPGTSVDSRGYVHSATKQETGHSQGYQLINDLLNGGRQVKIDFVSNDAYTQSGAGAQGTPARPGKGSTATVSYDPNIDVKLPTLQKDGTIKDESAPSSVVLAHELIHATHAQRGTIDRSMADHSFTDGSQKYKETWRFEELRTVGFPGQRQGNQPSENSIRAELGFNPRAAYLDRSSWVKVR